MGSALDEWMMRNRANRVRRDMERKLWQAERRGFKEVKVPVSALRGWLA